MGLHLTGIHSAGRWILCKNTFSAVVHWASTLARENGPLSYTNLHLPLCQIAKPFCRVVKRLQGCQPTCSETRLVNFRNFLAINFLTKEAFIFGDFLGFSRKTSIVRINCCGCLLGNFWKYLGYFVFKHLVTLVSIFNLSFYPHIFPLPNSNLNISFYLSSHLFIPTLNGGFLFSTTVRKVFFSRFDFISVCPFIFAHASTQPSFTFLSLLCLPSKSVQTGLLFLSKTCLFQGFLFHSSFLHCGSPATTAARLSRPLWIGSGPPPALRRVRACPGAVWWRETQ